MSGMKIFRWDLSLKSRPRPLPDDFAEWLDQFQQLASFVAELDGRLKVTTTLAQKLDKRSQRADGDASPENGSGELHTAEPVIRTGAPPPPGFGGV